MANCSGCGKYCGAKPVAHCPNCPQAGAVPAIGISAPSSLYDTGHDPTDAAVDQLVSQYEAYSKLREAENNLRAASVDALGRDIFEPRKVAVAGNSLQALQEGILLGGLKDGQLEEKIETVLDSAREAHSRGDSEETEKHVQIAASYATGQLLFTQKQNEAIKEAGVDPYGLMQEEDRELQKTADAMCARDWESLESGKELEDLETHHMFVQLFRGTAAE